jgi:FkbM family methyltransferase
VAHHPLFFEIPREPMTVPAGSLSDAVVGVHIRHAFQRGMAPTFVPPSRPFSTTPPLPAINEEYVEWFDLLETVQAASERYVFMELGAGFGRWMVRAVRLAQQWRGLPCDAIAVEAEPDHFRFLLQHCHDNGIDPAAHQCYWAALTAEGGFVPFYVGRADAWYGQAVAAGPGRPPLTVAAKRDLKRRAVTGCPPDTPPDEDIAWVPALTLPDIVTSHGGPIDLIHMDIQGAEQAVIPASLSTLTRFVRRMQIGTHGPEIEATLRTALRAAGWELLRDYACGALVDTEYGTLTFGDGMQSWLNPRLAS